ncbi:MAG TPA: hypothetical protein VM327_05540 [Candidatus Thermoplasmatota archaeon]|nr:hypothetical protein [Candidatus Thermoplasmatota archaeon]
MQVDWRAKDVPKHLDQLQSQYRLLWAGATGLAGAAGTVLWNVRRLLDEDATWAVAVGAILFLWLGVLVLQKFTANIIPSSTVHLGLEKLTFMRRFLGHSGAGSQRLLAVARALPNATIAWAAARLALDGYYPVLGWFFVYNFGMGVVFVFLPYFLTRNYVVRIFGGPLAALDTWTRNPKATRLDRKTMAGELAADDPSKPMRTVRTYLRFWRLGVVLAAPFYITLTAYLFFGGIRPTGQEFYEVAALAIAVLLGLCATWLVAVLLIDTTRALSQQLPELGGESEANRLERRSAGLMAIDALRENHHGYHRRLDQLLSQHDLVRLWRQGQERTGRR